MVSAKYISAGGQVVKLTIGADRFWRDEVGTIYAFADENSSIDSKVRCGVGLASLPDCGIFVEINEACGAHDYATTSPVYEAFHTYEEANRNLERSLRAIGYPLLGRIFSAISSRFSFAWDNKKTLK